jgi:UDP-N-acetylmuramyl pentapeptide synthase
VGSNGKTTVKEMTAAILRIEFGADHVLATVGNLNNEIGLPLTMLRLRSMHAAAAIEIGMNHSGETATLCAIAQPTIGVINNAQREHQEFMKSVADVAAEHASVLGALPDDGCAVLNADDDSALFWREVVAGRNADGASLTVRDFGLRAPAAISARFETQAWGSRVEVTTPEGGATFELKAPGRPNVSNALAAIAAATAAGAGIRAAATALTAFRRSSTTPTTPIPIRSKPRSRCSRMRRVRNGWSWAIWGRLAIEVRYFTAKSATTRAPSASIACSRSGSWRRTQSRHLARAENTLPIRIRWSTS